MSSGQYSPTEVFHRRATLPSLPFAEKEQQLPVSSLPGDHPDLNLTQGIRCGYPICYSVNNFIISLSSFMDCPSSYTDTYSDLLSFCFPCSRTVCIALPL